MSVRSVDSSTTRDPYAPKTGTYGTPVAPVPPSWGAPLPPPVGPANPYAPTHQPPRRGASEISDYGNTPTERYGYPVPPPLNTINPHGSGADLAPPTHAPYAPSPTLLGSNDPLGRVVGRAPVISFGFGGKLVTCFHGTGTLHTGFDVALSSRPSTDVRIRTASGLIPETSLAETAPVAYPGPLFNDPGTPTATSLVRTAASQTKTKKAQVLKYLEERGNELSQGLGYHQPDSLEGRELEGKLVLVQLLKVMIEHDGKLSGRYVKWVCV
jgi:COPII coat assembly protein SEC16